MKESVVRNAVKGLIGCLSIIMSVAASAGPLSFIFGDDEPKMEYFKNLPDCSDLKGHKGFTTKKQSLALKTSAILKNTFTVRTSYRGLEAIISLLSFEAITVIQGW